MRVVPGLGPSREQGGNIKTKADSLRRTSKNQIVLLSPATMSSHLHAFDDHRGEAVLFGSIGAFTVSYSRVMMAARPEFLAALIVSSARSTPTDTVKPA